MDPSRAGNLRSAAPGSIAAATIRSFSARDQLRRRCTEVITSICVLVIGVVLGLLLGLATMTQLRKAVLTGCLRYLFGCAGASALATSDRTAPRGGTPLRRRSTENTGSPPTGRTAEGRDCR